MLRNYLTTAFRNIVGSPLFSAINIIGLAIGLACCIIITVFVRYETSFDKHWDNADRIHRVTRDFFSNDLQLVRVAPPIAPLLAEDFPEIEEITRILQPGVITLIRDGITYREPGLGIADQNFPGFFNLEFVAGDAETALANPTNLVLTERTAEKYFGNEDPLGKTINVMGQADLTVTAILADLPDNTHMEFDGLMSIDLIPMMMGADALESWGSNNYFT
ncbi:MAG: ABC transporter permease, partial [Gammaproteobacteria bacterium]|nr:ABC transporter permease [Gammaproteobacteria bacterium]